MPAALRDGATTLRIGRLKDILSSEMAMVLSDFARVSLQFHLDVTAGLSRDLTRPYRKAERDIATVKQPDPQPNCRADLPEALCGFENLPAARDGSEPVPPPI